MKRFFKQLVIVAVVVVLLIVGAMWWHSHDRPTLTFTTVALKRGDIAATIGATGTIEPQEVVDVGAQVAGRVSTFCTDKEGKN